jgi:uncharacterized DUF497 family protein
VEIRFYIDPDSQRPHLESHGVKAAEAVEVLLSPMQDFAARDGARMAMGKTRGGRYLRVVYKVDDDSSIFVITAYVLSGKALSALKRRAKRKGGR